MGIFMGGAGAIAGTKQVRAQNKNAGPTTRTNRTIRMVMSECCALGRLHCERAQGDVNEGADDWSGRHLALWGVSCAVDG